MSYHAQRLLRHRPASSIQQPASRKFTGNSKYDLECNMKRTYSIPASGPLSPHQTAMTIEAGEGVRAYVDVLFAPPPHLKPFYD